jgi:hypothetical protein
VSGRRKGEYVPGLVYRALGWWPVVVGTYLLFLANILIHGFIIWTAPLERGAALGMAVIVILATVTMLRRGAFTPRAVLEVREEPGTGLCYAVVASGIPLTAEVRCEGDGGERAWTSPGDALPALSALRAVRFTIPTHDQRQLKIWTHLVTREGRSEPLAVRVDVDGGVEGMDMKLCRGELVVPATGATLSVTLTPERVVSPLTV